MATSARGVDFSALVNAQNSNTTYNAGGVLPLTRQQISLQGSLEQSRSTTDLAISGDGFFIVSTNDQQLSNGGSVLFTRAGSFTIDADGYMVNAQGLFLQGWPVASDGSVTSSPTSLSAIEPINISGVGGLAEPTGECRHQRQPELGPNRLCRRARRVRCRRHGHGHDHAALRKLAGNL